MFGKSLSVCLAGFAAMGAGLAFAGFEESVSLSCPEPNGWRLEKTVLATGEVTVVECRLAADKPTVPPKFEVFFRCPPRGAHNVWIPIDEKSERARLWATEWGATRYVSELAQGEPVCTAYDESENNALTIACSEAMRRVNYAITVNSTTADLEGRFAFFSVPEAPRTDYTVRVRIDRRRVFWAEAVRAASRWVAQESGLTPCPVPEAAFEPLYSSWYAFWQDVRDGEIEQEAVQAAALGMKTAILDDGWQKEKSKSYYSATGDWMPVATRFPDFRAHVDKVHAAGLKYMLWLSVPYVGHEAAAYARFKGKYLYDGANLACLDPRFPEVRDYLIGTYERCVRDWDFDGLKLDFIDAMQAGNDPAEKDNYAGRDCKTVPEGIDRLMSTVQSRLAAIKPDVLLEFRQRYIGPAVRRYGNMLRATDCPYDILGNRKRIADLRLTSGGTAVHSDMLVWSPSDLSADAARVILNAIFGVVQYSMKLSTVSDEHRDLIRHWIGFSVRHREALLKGDFRPHHPELMYPWIEAESAGEKIVAVYGEGQVVPLGKVEKPTFVLNATAAGKVVLDLAQTVRVQAFDTLGRAVAERELPAGLNAVEVPVSGFLELRK